MWTWSCKSSLDLKKEKLKFILNLKLFYCCLFKHHCCEMEEKRLKYIFFQKVMISFFFFHSLIMSLMSIVFLQGLLLRGLHGAREEHRQSVRSEVSQEETSRSQQPGKRNPCPKKVKYIKNTCLNCLVLLFNVLSGIWSASNTNPNRRSRLLILYTQLWKKYVGVSWLKSCTVWTRSELFSLQIESKW